MNVQRLGPEAEAACCCAQAIGARGGVEIMTEQNWSRAAITEIVD